MRKLKFILVAILLTSFSGVAMADSPPEPSYSSAVKKLSVGQSQSTPTRVIKLVRLASRDDGTVSLASGDVVRYNTVSDDGVTVQHTSTTADGAIAGIVVTTVQTADAGSASAKDDEGRRNWGWIIVHGPAIARSVAGGTNAHSIGDPFITSRDAGSVTSFEATVFSGDGAVTLAHIEAFNTSLLKSSANTGGFFLDAADSSATAVEVFVTLE